MQAIVLTPGTTNVRLGDRPEPQVSAPDAVKMRVIRVGICGTDREEVRGGRAKAPDGQSELVIGHEMLGQVTEVGTAVRRVQPGDYAVFTVRRGCGHCLPCLINRSDMCLTGDYRERGIWRLDGYQTELVVDSERYIVRVPPELEPVGVLCEPMTIAEKAIDEALRIQFARMPASLASPAWLHGRPCLVAGLGPVGLLAALALRLRGAEVYGMDIVDAGSVRPKWLEHIGGHYVDGRKVAPNAVRSSLEPMDFIFEATGNTRIEFNLIDALGKGGIYMITGIPGGDRSVCLPGAELMQRLVLNNQVMAGSVNASRDHFQMAIDDLRTAHLRWGDHIARLITHRHPHTDFAAALSEHLQDAIKIVVEWGKGSEQ